MKLLNKTSIELASWNTKHITNNPQKMSFGCDLEKVMFMPIFILCVALICTCVYGENLIPLDATTEKKVQDLVKELHKAEDELELLVQEAEKKHPELRKYKDWEKEISEWYWGKRMVEWGEMAPELYGSDPGEKDARFKIFERAKHFAFYIYLCELSKSPEKEEILKWYFSSEESRNDFAKKIGISFSDPEDFLQKVKTFFKAKKPEFEKIASTWRQKYEFITASVWDQAYKDSTSEFEMEVLDTAIDTLTPQNVKDAEDKVKKIKHDLEQTWPDWDEIHKEIKPAVDRIIEEESLSIINSDSFQNPLEHQPVEKTNKAAQSSVKITETKPVAPFQKTQANTLQPQKTHNQYQWLYVLLVVGAIWGFFILTRCIRRKVN
jgi:hypothetical protein